MYLVKHMGYFSRLDNMQYQDSNNY